MADVDIPITAGTGTNIRCFQTAAGDYDQYVREVRATAVAAPVSWTATTAGTTSVVAADATRVSMIIVSQAQGTVYLRFDTTLPTSALFTWYVQPGDRWEVPAQFTQRAVSMAASSSGGFVLVTSGTCA